MSKRNAPEHLTAIDPTDLEAVAGGAARVTARASAGNTEVLSMLDSIGDTLKDLASNNSNSSSDMMQMMMMMMMMNGQGGQQATPPYINIFKGKRGC